MKNTPRKQRKNRCWPGYEPVPGKKEHSQGSCRPESKAGLSSEEKKFRTARKRQLIAGKMLIRQVPARLLST